MHWLEARLSHLNTLFDVHGRLRARRGDTAAEQLFEAHGATLEDGLHDVRQRLYADTQEVVLSVGARRGVEGAFVAHEGLVVASAGPVDFEAYAAIASSLSAFVAEASERLTLGRIRQFVLVGERQKLAVFVLDGLLLGIVCPAALVLGDVLAEGGPDLSAAEPS